MNGMITATEPCVASWNPTVVGALIALAGGLIGACIGSTTNYLIARQKRDDDARAELEKRALDAKKAARLIEVDFLDARAVAKASLEQRRWNTTPLSIDYWKTYASVLAPVCLEKDWDAIQDASQAAEHVIEIRKISLEHTLVFDADITGQLQGLIADLTKGADALHQWHADKASLPTSHSRS